MIITLPLGPEKHAKLAAVARSKGMTADDLVSEVIDKLIAEAPGAASPKEPTHSLRGLLAKYGPAPSAEEIDQSRTDMFAKFPCTDL
jgi:hypothetical protein